MREGLNALPSERVAGIQTVSAATLDKPTPIASTAFTVLFAISFCHLLNDMMQSLLPAIYPKLKVDFGLSFGQIGRVYLVTLLAAVVAGSIGSTIALWRDSTYQTLALTVLVLVAWIAAGEAVAHGAFGAVWQGISTEVWAAGLSPRRTVLTRSRPSPFLASSPGPL